MGPRAKEAAQVKLMFGVFAEGDDTLVLRTADGKRERKLVLSAATLARFSLDDVAQDLYQDLDYNIKDQQGSEDTRR